MSPVPDLPNADAIAAAIDTCPSVLGLSGGLAGEIATYLPGRRVAGVRASPGSVEIHVISRYGSPLSTVDAEVRAAVQAAVPGPLTVDVILADVEDPFAPPEEEPSEPKALEAGPSAQLPAGPSAGSLPPVTPGATPMPGSAPTSPPPLSGATRVTPPASNPPVSVPPNPIPPVPPAPSAAPGP